MKKYNFMKHVNPKIAAISAFVSAGILVASLILGILVNMNGNLFLSRIGGVIATILLLIFTLIKLDGYLNFSKPRLLVIMVWTMMALVILNSAAEVWSNLGNFPTIILITTWALLGLATIVFGTSILKLKKIDYGTPIGVLYIIQGAFNITIILAILGSLMAIPIYIVEGLMFLKAAKK